ncbi:MAG TPA: DegV family protein [Acidimicrobiales bacterium]|jgi:DegV family protein with EDD domain|nr:DegV family protein [Acidimicrobiales bacterium]
MAPVRIVTDSACDLPKALLAEHRIEVVPLTIRFGTEEFTDGVDLSTAEFWKRCASSARLPETAAPSPGAFQAVYERLADEGADGVVAVTLSSELSATYQAAVLGAEAVAGRIEVRVVDSRLVTAAEGLLALEAATLAAGGASVGDVASRTAARVSDADLVGTIDTMDHLVKSGRLSGAKAVFGSLLSVKPILTVRDGLVVEGGRQRTRARALEHLATRAEAAAPFDWLAVGGGDADDLGVVVERLSGIDSTHPMIVTEIGPVVGTHAGPGIVGVCWLTRHAA